MSTKRRRFSASEKAKIALEAIKGELTLAQISAKYAVHATQINVWKKRVLTYLPDAIVQFKSIDLFSTTRLIAKKVNANDFDKFIAVNANQQVMATLGGTRDIEQSKKDLERHLDQWKKKWFWLLDILFKKYG